MRLAARQSECLPVDRPTSSLRPSAFVPGNASTTASANGFGFLSSGRPAMVDLGTMPPPKSTASSSRCGARTVEPVVIQNNAPATGPPRWRKLIRPTPHPMPNQHNYDGLVDDPRDRPPGPAWMRPKFRPASAVASHNTCPRSPSGSGYGFGTPALARGAEVAIPGRLTL